MTVDLHAQALRLVAADGTTIADSAELQGTWTVEQYLRITDYSSRLLEYADGELEVLPMPTDKHQVILAYLYRVLYPYVEQIGGIVLFAALRLRIREDKFREPDLLLVMDANDPRRGNAYWLGADLVVEIVSPDDPERDTVVKRADYAEGRIPEYWIVNPLDESITVLRLAGDQYAEHGVFRRGDTAGSALLEGFSVQVDAVFDAR
jgi:Uma2 family endonuclease